MRATTTEETTNFNPVTISLTFETKEELSLFAKIMQANCSIPHVMVKEGRIPADKEIILTKLMGIAHEQFHKSKVDYSFTNKK